MIQWPFRHLFAVDNVSNAVDRETESDKYKSKDEHKQTTDLIGQCVISRLVADIEADETQPND